MAGNLTNMIASIFSGSAVTPDPYFEYTTLLLPGSGTNGAQNNTFLDGSTNNFTITRNGNTTQGTFSPFSQTGWGNYFDGTGDYLTAPDNAALNLSGDFTVETWVYLANVTGEKCVFHNHTSDNNGIALNVNGAAPRILSGAGTWNIVLDSSITISANTWNHIAATRSGNTYTIWVNGVSGGTASSATNPTYSGGAQIGRFIAATPLAFNGYASNLRVVKGVAVYTGAFTPPTSPLAATQSAATNISSITGTQTSLLTCQSNRFIDNSTNNFTITRNGDTSVVAFSPFNPTASWSAATYGGSGYFDGSGDYLNFTDSANNLDLGGVQASMDVWFYRTSSGSDNDDIIIKRGPGAWSATDGIEYIVRLTGSTITIYYNTGGSFGIWSTGITYIPFQWNHLCVATNTSNNISVFLNGTTKATSTFSIAKPTTRTTVNIGVDSAADANYFTGYMSGMRFITGSNAFDPTASSITVPTAPPTVVTGTQLLLNYTNAGVYDATSKNDLETVADAQISNAVTPKWGSTSIKFDGTGDWLDALASNQLFNLSSGDWTIEAWIYRNASGAVHTILNLFNASANNSGLTFYVNASNQLVTDNGTVAALAAGTVASGQWVHVAIVRSGGTTTGYVDGTSVGTTTQAPAASQYARIGALASGFNLFNGYIQDLRITKGYARYVTGTGANAGKMVFNGTNNLALPTAAFPTF